MKIIVIILGLSVNQIQQKSSMDMGISNLYDIDSRAFRGPLTVRYQIKNVVIELPGSELVSLSFRMGILTSADVTPHRTPLDSTETAGLCRALQKTFLGHGFTIPEAEAREFKKFTDELKLGHEPAGSPPPWRFGWDTGDESVNIVIRPFESWSEPNHNIGKKQYTIMLEFGNSAISETVYAKMKAVKAKYFPNRTGQIPMSEYPKEFSQPQ